MPITGFRPIMDGFSFKNSFNFDDHEKQIIQDAFNAATLAVSPQVRAALNQAVNAATAEVYGLCGGMAFAALDYYRTAPHSLYAAYDPSEPTRNTPAGTIIRDYLWRRLVEGFAAGTATTTLLYMAWIHYGYFMGMGPRGPWFAKEQSRPHWQNLKEFLDRGEPRPIALVGTTKDPFNNHQVVAYGYDDSGDDAGTLYVYDPNCAGAESTIDLDFSGDELVAIESCPSEDRGPLRGFFLTDYAPIDPPEIRSTNRTLAGIVTLLA